MSPWEGELIEVERNGRKVKVIMRMRITMRVSSIVGKWENVRKVTWKVISLGLDQRSWGKSSKI